MEALPTVQPTGKQTEYVTRETLRRLAPATLAAGILRIAFTNAKLTPAATRERITFVSKSRATTGIQIANSGTST
jgi:hypothetical protein